MESTSPDSLASNIDDGDRVTIWQDINPQSTNKNNCTTGGTSVTYSDNSINNLPSVRFNGTTSSLLSFDGTSLAKQNYTIFVVEKRASNDTGCFIGGLETSSNGALNLCYSANNTISFSQVNNDILYQNNHFTLRKPTIHSFHFSSDLGKKYYLNGSLQTPSSTSGSSYDLNSALTSFNSARIGKSNSGVSSLDDYIGEIIIFNKALSEKDRIDVTKYLSQKWSIAVS